MFNGTPKHSHHSMTDPTFTNVDSEELAKQLYDVLMAEIEPDLLLTNIPLLDKKYAGETPEEKAVRMKRYEVAYKEFDRQFSEFMVDVNGEVRTTKRKSLEAKEEESHQSDQQVLSSLETAFS